MCTRADGPGQGSVILLPICTIPKFYIVLDLAVTATTTTTTTTTTNLTANIHENWEMLVITIQIVGIFFPFPHSMYLYDFIVYLTVKLSCNSNERF